MLERLEVSGYAVARSVVIEPGPELNVFTGETGAGKSLVADALAFALGARRGREVVAAGFERATVTATLRVAGRKVVVERAVGLSGRTVSRIDGETATAPQLTAAVAGTADIHGQSDQLDILRSAAQTEVLDQFGGLTELRGKVAAEVRALRDTRRRLQALALDARERERLAERLRHETAEIDAAQLEPGEDERLRAEQLRLAGVSRLREAAAAAMAALDEGGVAAAARAVAELTGYDPSAVEIADLGALFESAAADLGRALRRYSEGLDDDPERLTVIAERLDLIARLRRRYGDTMEEVLAYGAEAAARLAALEHAGITTEGLHVEEAATLARLGPLVNELSRARRSAAAQLAAAVAAALPQLGLPGARLAAGFACEDDPGGPVVALPDFEVVGSDREPGPEPPACGRAVSEAGADQVELLASFNPGEALRPLAAVASGGEASRFFLALTGVLAEAAPPRTIVFDEVDEGVGGRTGALIGEALRRLAARHQVLCITHLPQVAAYGARHFVVTKHSDGARTWSEATPIDGEARVAELAAMIGGPAGAATAAARALLESASAVVAAHSA